MTQQDAVSYWNNKGQAMLSAPDFYNILKQGSDEDIATTPGSRPA